MALRRKLPTTGASIVTVALFTGCTDSLEPPPASELDQAIARWDTVGLEHYRHLYYENLGQEHLYAWVVVHRDTVTAAWDCRALDCFGPTAFSSVGLIEGASLYQYPSIGGLFDLIESMSGSLNVEYDPLMGYPRSIAVNYNPGSRSSRTHIAVEAVRPLTYGFAFDELRAMQELWDTAGSNNYRLRFMYACMCHNSMEPATVEVQGGNIVSASWLSSGLPVDSSDFAHFRTVRELFDRIQLSIDREPWNFAVTYDSSFGYPTYVFEDPVLATADDEYHLYVSDLELLAPSPTSDADSRYPVRLCQTRRGPGLVPVRSSILNGRKLPRLFAPTGRIAYPVQYLLGLGHNRPHGSMTLVHEPLVDRSVQLRDQRIEKPASVYQNNWLQVFAEPLECYGL